MSLKNHCDACDALAAQRELFVPACSLPGLEVVANENDKHRALPANFQDFIISFRSLNNKSLTICISCLHRLCRERGHLFEYLTPERLEGLTL